MDNLSENLDILDEIFKSRQERLGVCTKEIKENKELLYLQNQFKMGKIKEKDLSIEERIGLEKLYKQQIYDLKKSIENYKNKILIIKKLL